MWYFTKIYRIYILDVLYLSLEINFPTISRSDVVESLTFDI